MFSSVAEAQIHQSRFLKALTKVSGESADMEQLHGAEGSFVSQGKGHRAGGEPEELSR